LEFPSGIPILTVALDMDLVDIRLGAQAAGKCQRRVERNVPRNGLPSLLANAVQGDLLSRCRHRRQGAPSAGGQQSA
jgi:hypothetical protein